MRTPFPRRRVILCCIALLVVPLLVGFLAAQPPWSDPEFQRDRDTFHYLLMHRDAIHRTVHPLPDGVITLTESGDPDVAARIQEHVRSMHRRLTEGRPIHRRDPLFAELFAHADAIRMEVEYTMKGVKVVETSDDPYVVRLVQAHAEVVSQFLANGPPEVRRNHEVPSR